MQKVCVEIPEGKSAKWIDGVLTLVDNETEKRVITDRIKSFEDACRELGEDNPLVVAYQCNEEIDECNNDLIAYLKLRIICAALNEGWTPALKENEYRYYPWFYLCTKKELEDMTKDDLKQSRGLLFGGSAYSGASAGCGYAFSGYAPSSTYADVGSRLCLKSEELAVYCGKQFIEIWFAYHFPQFTITKTNWEDQ